MGQFKALGLIYFQDCKPKMSWSWNAGQYYYNLGVSIHGMVNDFMVTSSEKGILQ